VVEMLERARIGCALAPVTITSGDEVAELKGWWRVPKRDLVTNLQVMLEERKLRVAGGMAEAATLVREMQEMRVKITPSGREVYAARGTGEHDDLVMAVALAAWWLERKRWGGQRVGEQSRRLVRNRPWPRMDTDEQGRAALNRKGQGVWQARLRIPRSWKAAAGILRRRRVDPLEYQKQVRKQST
jgi:hypothetical protein